MSLCKEIQNAKCCVAKFSERYVKAVTFGIDTDDMFYELVLLKSYISALERYECNPTKTIEHQILLSYDNFLLADNDKVLSLGVTCETVSVNPNEVNCLTQDEVCFILEQIHLKCEQCACGC